MRVNGHYSKVLDVTFNVRVHHGDGTVECVATGMSPEEALQVAAIYMQNDRDLVRITIHDNKEHLYAEWDRVGDQGKLSKKG